ncbi:hypothetical protein AB0N05_21885 [Nocardia sp. NPDC051030]|uniref:hypothetical protein n=1 Tax=Nocardia sp. NPDC051030 TaxID=3155162 RepID=UPI00343B8F4D
MNQPYPDNSTPGNLSGAARQQPSLPLDVSVVAQSGTAIQLQRATLPMMIRSPLMWILVATIPLILMAKHIFDVITNTSHNGDGLLGIIKIYFGLLAVTLVLMVPVIAMKFVWPSKDYRAYASKGKTLRVLYRQDSLDVILATGTTTVSYDEIDELTDHGPVVYLRYRVWKGVSLPRELFPAEALALMGREIEPQGRRR